MKKLTVFISRYPRKEEVAVFQSKSIAALHLRYFLWRLWHNKAAKADGFEISNEITDCTLADIIRNTKITVA